MRVSSSSEKKFDVAVVGAGPTGCAAALAFARRGASVALLEGNPSAANRFAGEWIHPPGVRALEQLGVDIQQLASCKGYGFALFGDDGGDPVCLPYAGGVALSRHHAELVNHLREQAKAQPQVTYLPHHFVHALEQRDPGCVAVMAENRARASQALLRAERVIGADGRSSKVRACLDLDGVGSDLISYMAGVELRDVRLPFEGMGHVFLGGPGPAMFYRIDEHTVRACLDVPQTLPAELRRKEALYGAFEPVLPEQLRPAFQRALSQRFTWAATRVKRREAFGRGRVWLVGDAVGHVHPISGVGMTLGILDAVAAAEAQDLSQYRRQRQLYVTELLAKCLYFAFVGADPSAARVRHGLLEMLRRDPTERIRTMQILTGERHRGVSFARSFLRASGRVVLSGVERTAMQQQSLDEWTSQLRQDLHWLAWPLNACLGPAARLRAPVGWSGPAFARSFLPLRTPSSRPKRAIQ